MAISQKSKRIAQRAALAALTLAAPTPLSAASEIACPDAPAVLRDIGAIDMGGARPGSVNLALNSRVLALARCHAGHADAAAAEAVVRALVRYGEVVPSWPRLDRSGQPAHGVDLTYWNLGGLWGGIWVFEDLVRSADLARAYELVRHSAAVAKISAEFGIDADHVIRERLLRYLVDHNLRFGRGSKLGSNTTEAFFPFYNMDPLRLSQLVVFGRVVDPAYTHIAVRLLRDFPRVAFFRDGFWHEGSVSYHRQVVDRLDEVIVALAGSSDPPGYSHTGYTTLFGDRYDGVPGRFDHLDPLGPLQPVFARMRAATHALTFPDGRMAARNDTHAFERGPPIDAPATSTCLLGLRHCVLVAGREAGRTIVHLTFGGTDGHEHLDKLHVDIWGGGRMLASDGDYLKGSPRAWNHATAAHNTVLVDRKDQDDRFTQRRPLTVLDRIDGIGHHLWQGYGQGDTNNQDDLIAAGLGDGPVQHVTAEAHRAYDGHASVSTYMRTVILVADRGGEPYVIDLFRISGGREHIWMLHGDLASDASLSTTLAAKAASGSLVPFLEADRSATAARSWRSDFVYADGRRLATYHPQPRQATVTLAHGPAHAPSKRAPYLAILRRGPDNIFVAVHDVSGTGNALRRVVLSNRPTRFDDPVHLRIALSSGRTDTLVVGEGKRRRLSAFTLTARKDDGSCVWRYRGDEATATSDWREGLVSVREPQATHAGGFVVAGWPDAATSRPDFLHVQLANGVVESYRVMAVKPLGKVHHLVEVDGEPGLALLATKAGGEPAAVKQTAYPAQGIVGIARWRTTSNGAGCGH